MNLVLTILIAIYKKRKMLNLPTKFTANVSRMTLSRVHAFIASLNFPKLTA